MLIYGYIGKENGIRQYGICTDYEMDRKRSENAIQKDIKLSGIEQKKQEPVERVIREPIKSKTKRRPR